MKSIWLKWVVLTLALGVAVSACDRASELPSFPPGAWLHGSAADVRVILATLEALPRTPAAQYTQRLSARLADCDEVFGHAPDGSVASLLENVHCAKNEVIPEDLASMSRKAALAFVFSVAEKSRVVGVLERDPGGSLIAHARLMNPDPKTFTRLLIPSSEPAGPPTLSARDALVQVRVRPAGGLDVASLIAPESQADKMFRLRSQLFFGHVLDGSWEAAIYMPRHDRATPPMALALDFSIRAAAARAMSEFVFELESAWRIERTPETFGDFEGACFYSVRLLPDLMPCYALSDRSIVVGWNPTSIELALGIVDDAPEAQLAAFGPYGGLRIHLDRLPEADRRLKSQFGQSAAYSSAPRPWDVLQVEAKRARGGVQFRLELRASSSS